MDQKQSFNLSADFLGGFSSIFMKLVFVIISVYIIILILNFLRDKFISVIVNYLRTAGQLHHDEKNYVRNIDMTTPARLPGLCKNYYNES